MPSFTLAGALNLSVAKGGLYILGHVLKGEFGSAIDELQFQQHSWLGLVDRSGIKAFVDLAIAPDERAGCRNLLLTSGTVECTQNPSRRSLTPFIEGIGGMRPNICMLVFPENAEWRRRGKVARRRSISDSESDTTVRAEFEDSRRSNSLGDLPTDSQRTETPITATSFVGIIEDALLLKKAVGLAYGFTSLQTPSPSHSTSRSKEKEPPRWIDVWPILPEGDSAWETYTSMVRPLSGRCCADIQSRSGPAARHYSQFRSLVAQIARSSRKCSFEIFSASPKAFGRSISSASPGKCPKRDGACNSSSTTSVYPPRSGSACSITGRSSRMTALSRASTTKANPGLTTPSAGIRYVFR